MAKRAKSLGMRLEAMALEIPEFPDHPNRVPFSGVLTRVNVPSDRAPNGASGHRVLLPRDVAKKNNISEDQRIKVLLTKVDEKSAGQKIFGALPHWKRSADELERYVDKEFDIKV